MKYKGFEEIFEEEWMYFPGVNLEHPEIQDHNSEEKAYIAKLRELELRQGTLRTQLYD